MIYLPDTYNSPYIKTAASTYIPLSLSLNLCNVTCDKFDMSEIFRSNYMSMMYGG